MSRLVVSLEDAQRAAAEEDMRLRSDADRALTNQARREAQAVSDALAAGANPEDVQRYSGLLSARDRERLRSIVRNEHLRYYPRELLTDAECDKFIDSFAESYLEQQLRRGAVY